MSSTSTSTDTASHNRFVIDPERTARQVLAGAIVAEFVLLALNYIFNFYDIAGDISIRRMFNIAREQSVPTFFASLQAVAVGSTALALRTTTTNRVERRGWMVAGVFWIYVGIDDNAEIHERLGSALGRATEGSALESWWPTFSWQIFLAPFLALGLLASVLIADRFTKGQRLLLFACLACFAVAQGIDFLEGIEDQFDDWADDLGVEPYTVGHVLRSTEEMLEMFGTTAFWAAVLPTLATRLVGGGVTFTPDESSNDDD